MAKKAKSPAETLAVNHDLSVSDLAFALRFLTRYGYLDPQGIDETAVEQAAEKFQETAEIEVDGLLGPQTLEAMWAPRCGCPDNAFTQAARWRKKKLKLWVADYLRDVPGLSVQDQKDLQDEGMKHFAAAIDVEWSRATSQAEADLVVSTGEGKTDQFDGPGGVLAWCQIPPGDERQILMKFDRGDNWIKSADAGRRGILYRNVFNHEFGHGHGMLHVTGGKKALLNPLYDSSVAFLLPADHEVLMELGYARGSAQPPTPTPAAPANPSGGTAKREIITLVVERIVDAAIPGYKKMT